MILFIRWLWICKSVRLYRDNIGREDARRYQVCSTLCFSSRVSLPAGCPLNHDLLRKAIYSISFHVVFSFNITFHYCMILKGFLLHMWTLTASKSHDLEGINGMHWAMILSDMPHNDRYFSPLAHKYNLMIKYCVMKNYIC